jgi:hypothetical protein
MKKTLRFEVFKRDSFTCQYCGRVAPDVVLEIDHIQPVSKDGDDDLFNLTTACFDCNRGKTNRLLSDNSVIRKQKKQLDELQSKKEQIEMLFEWKKGLLNVDDFKIQKLAEYLDGLTPGFVTTDTGKQKIRLLLKKFTMEEIMDAMNVVTEKYIELDSDGHITKESMQLAFNKIGGVCFTTKQAKNDPDLPRFHYLYAIFRNKTNGNLPDRWKCKNQVDMWKSYLTIEQLIVEAKSYNTWYHFSNAIEEKIEQIKCLDATSEVLSDDVITKGI